MPIFVPSRPGIMGTKLTNARVKRGTISCSIPCDPTHTAGFLKNDAACGTSPAAGAYGATPGRGLGLDLYENTRRNLDAIDRLHRAGGRFADIDNPLVRTHLKLFAGLFVDMRPAKHRIPLNSRRERDRSVHLRAGALGLFDDFPRGRIQRPRVICFHSYSDSILRAQPAPQPLADRGHNPPAKSTGQSKVADRTHSSIFP